MKQILKQKFGAQPDIQSLVRIYTFFRQNEINTLSFSIDDLSQAFFNNEPNFLLQYLLTNLFELYLSKEDFTDPYITLLLNKNRAVRQCLIFNQLQSIYELTLSYYKIQYDGEYNSEEFFELDAENKFIIFLNVINQIIPKSKWMKGIMAIKLQFYQNLGSNYQNNRKEWQEELHELLNKNERLKFDLTNLQKRSKYSSKKQIKEISNLMNENEKRIEQLSQLLSLNNDDIKFFGINYNKIIYKDEELIIWIFKSLPDSLLININDEFYLIYGQQCLDFLKQFDHINDKLQQQNITFTNENKKENINKFEFKLDLFGFKEFEKLGGQTSNLLYCQNKISEIQQIKIMLLDIEEKISSLFGTYYESAWNYQTNRIKWREQIKQEENIEEQLYSIFTEKMKSFQTKYFDYNSENEVPENYESKTMPYFCVYKYITQNLDTVKSHPYTYCLTLYSRFLEMHNTNLENKKQKQKEKRESERYQTKGWRSARIIEDEESSLSDYYYN